MSNKPSDGRQLIDSISGNTLLSITRITLSSTSTLLSTLLAAGTTTPPYANNTNQATGQPYAAPYVDEQIRAIAFVGVGATSMNIAINNPASSAVGTLSVPTSLQPAANQMPCNQSVALTMQLKGSGTIDVYQFG